MATKTHLHKGAVPPAPPEAGAEGARRATGAPASGGAARLPQPPLFDPEVAPIIKRRRFTNQDKQRILKEADACTKPGEMGALLRREGIYSSAIASWRQQRREGLLAGTSGRTLGGAPDRKDLLKQMAELEQKNRSLERKLKQAEIIIDAQKKISEILQLSDQTERNSA